MDRYLVTNNVDGLLHHVRADPQLQLIYTRKPRDVKTRLQRMKALALDFDGTAAVSDHPTSLDHLMDDIWDERKRTRRRAWQPDMNLLTHPHDVYDRYWIGDNAALYADVGITQDHITQAGADIPLRDGTVELINHFGHRRTIIISMGIAPIIEAAFRSRNIHCKVAAARLRFEDGRVRGMYSHDDIVTGSRKGLELERFCTTIGVTPGQCLVAGDSYGDRELFKIGGLCVFVIPYKDGVLDLIPHRLEALQHLWHRIDVIVMGTLRPIYDLLRAASIS